MLRLSKILSAAALLLSVGVNLSHADECDPSKILHENVVKAQSNLLVFMSYVNDVLRSTEKSEQQGVGVSYAGVGINWNDAKSLSDFLESHEGFALSKQQATSILRSTLSDSSVDAYKACINAGGLAIDIPDAAMNEEEFQFRVFWHPKGTVSDGAHKLSIRASNGDFINIDETTSNAQSIDIKINEPSTFDIKRNIDKTLFITAKIETDSDSISLPARPQFLLKSKVLTTKPDSLKRSDHDGLSTIDRDECVTSEDGALIVPSTMKFVGQTYGPDAKATPNPAKSDSTSACGIFHAHSGCRTHDCDAGISGYFSVVEFYTAPRQQ